MSEVKNKSELLMNMVETKITGIKSIFPDIINTSTEIITGKWMNEYRFSIEFNNIIYIDEDHPDSGKQIVAAKKIFVEQVKKELFEDIQNKLYNFFEKLSMTENYKLIEDCHEILDII